MRVNEELALQLCATHCELYGNAVSHPPLMVKHFSAQLLSESLGSPRDRGQYLIAFYDAKGRIIHFAVDDQSGNVEVMEDL